MPAMTTGPLLIRPWAHPGEEALLLTKIAFAPAADQTGICRSAFMLVINAVEKFVTLFQFRRQQAGVDVGPPNHRFLRLRQPHMQQ